MFNEPTASTGGDVAEKPKAAKKPSRAERVAAWRAEHRDAYLTACEQSECTCTPTRAQMLLLNQWVSPPVD